jgi:hypothetical protein
LKSYNRLPSRAFIDECQSRTENDPTVPALSVRARFPPPELPDICSLLTLPAYQASVLHCSSSQIRGKS